jgi:hypothetical protein
VISLTLTDDILQGRTCARRDSYCYDGDIHVFGAPFSRNHAEPEGCVEEMFRSSDASPPPATETQPSADDGDHQPETATGGARPTLGPSEKTKETS